MCKFINNMILILNSDVLNELVLSWRMTKCVSYLQASPEKDGEPGCDDDEEDYTADLCCMPFMTTVPSSDDDGEDDGWSQCGMDDGQSVVLSQPTSDDALHLAISISSDNSEGSPSKASQDLIPDSQPTTPKPSYMDKEV